MTASHHSRVLPDSEILTNMKELIQLRRLFVDMRYAENEEMEETAFRKLMDFIENAQDKELWRVFTYEVGFYGILNQTHFSGEKMVQIPASGIKREEFEIDPAHAGDNWVVGVSPVASILDDARVSETGTKSTLEMTPVTNRVYQQVLYQSAMLTTWRTLWMELDRMKVPGYRTGPYYDGFDPAKEYAGSTTDSNGNAITGLWATYQISNEPDDFDMAFQPPKPDISLLTTAMTAACITVREVTQGADGTTNTTWITGDSASTNPNEWDNTTPFVHNLSHSTNDVAVSIGNESRDVNINEEAFWCVQAVGGYESEIASDGDSNEENYKYGGATNNNTAMFLVFNEAIRDRIQRNGNGFVAAARNETEFRQLVAYHEALHMFGFADNITDGPIMVSGWITASTLSLEVTTLSDAQIKKVQERDYPH